jgi:hypothetical protein
LTAKAIVELPSSALASEELSKWREDENKHQLEIITKAELDALAQTKIVLKSHKGEEVIEKQTDPVDISLPDDEDVESIITKNVLSADDPHGKYDLSKSISLNLSSGGGHSISSPLSSPSISSSTGKKSDSHHRSRSRSKSRDRHHSHHHHSSSKSSSKHKKSDRSRSPRHHTSSSSHRRSRDKSHGRKSRDKSHDRSRDRDHKKKDEHKHRDKSKSNEKERSKSSKDSKDTKKHHSHHSHHHHHRSSSKEAKDNSIQESKEIKILEIEPAQEDRDLVGQILNSMGVHLDTKPEISETTTTTNNDDGEKTKAIEKSSDVITSSTTPAQDQIVPVSADPVNEHQLAIEIYSGCMYMADVSKFEVTASVVSGNVDDIMKSFTPQLDIVGRIEPKTVCDYLDKVKKIAGKELVVLRFASSDESAYFQLFSYLHTRQRYGVIKSHSAHIKDFYLITVEAKKPLPSVLLPIIGPGFIEGDENKPDLLLGVILKILPESKVSLLKKFCYILNYKFFSFFSTRARKRVLAVRSKNPQK